MLIFRLFSTHIFAVDCVAINAYGTSIPGRTDSIRDVQRTATPQRGLVTTVANQLMTVDAATSAEVSQRVLAYLVERLGVGVSFAS